MDHRQKSALVVAIAAGVAGMAVADDAQATTYSAVLTDVRYYSNGATAGAPFNISSSTGLTWSYDDVTKLITQTGGLLNARFSSGPTIFFRHSITGLVIGNGAAASASSFVCTEGSFGLSAGVSLCGNYLFGGNFTQGANFGDESTTTWGPGTAVSRTIGGDDMVAGPQQSIALLNAMSTISWVGTTLVLANKTCTGTCTTMPGAYNNGYQYTFTAGPQVVVPVPAAVWLFGSPLGVMGLMRRRSAAQA